jgi:RNA polymerase sigma factor (sigma-70 family)
MQEWTRAKLHTCRLMSQKDRLLESRPIPPISSWSLQPKTETIRHTQSCAAFSSWLTRIAINSALMSSRKKRSHYVYSLEGGVDGDDFKLPEPTETAHSPEESCILNALENECVRAIRYLPPTLRVVVQIRYRENASVAQIAKMLGISESAVKSRLLRARSKIRAHLEKTQYLPCGINPKAMGGCSTSVGFIEAGAA